MLRVESALLRTPRDPLLAGYAAGVGSALVMGTMSALVYLADGVAPEGVAFARAAIGLAVAIPICWRELPTLLARDSTPLWLFGVSGAASLIALYWNLANVSVGTALALFNIAPLFALGISWVFSKQPIGRLAVAGTVMVTVAAVALRRPSGTGMPPQVMVVGLCGAFAAAIAYTALGKASRHASPELSLVTVCLAILLVAPLVSSPRSWHVNSWSLGAVVALIGVLGVVGHLLMARSFATLPVTIATSLVPTSLLWSVLVTLWDYLPTWVEWCSYATMMLGAVALRLAVAEHAPGVMEPTPAAHEPSGLDLASQ